MNDQILVVRRINFLRCLIVVAVLSEPSLLLGDEQATIVQSSDDTTAIVDASIETETQKSLGGADLPPVNVLKLVEFQDHRLQYASVNLKTLQTNKSAVLIVRLIDPTGLKLKPKTVSASCLCTSITPVSQATDEKEDSIWLQLKIRTGISEGPRRIDVNLTCHPELEEAQSPEDNSYHVTFSVDFIARNRFSLLQSPDVIRVDPINLKTNQFVVEQFFERSAEPAAIALKVDADPEGVLAKITGTETRDDRAITHIDIELSPEAIEQRIDAFTLNVYEESATKPLLVSKRIIVDYHEMLDTYPKSIVVDPPLPNNRRVKFFLHVLLGKEAIDTLEISSGKDLVLEVQPSIPGVSYQWISDLQGKIEIDSNELFKLSNENISVIARNSKGVEVVGRKITVERSK